MNGKEVGRTENMFRRYVFVQGNENQIQVQIENAAKGKSICDSIERRHGGPAWGGRKELRQEGAVQFLV